MHLQVKIVFGQQMKIVFALAFALVFSCVNNSTVLLSPNTDNPKPVNRSQGRIGKGPAKREKSAPNRDAGIRLIKEGQCRGMPDTAFAW